jgi:molybdenum cofactor cytidylyltransferase
VMAGIAVTGDDIMDMGAGGLLAEIPSRPSPRELTGAPRVVAVVLAAGKSTRMGAHKMLADFAGRPLLRVAVENVLESSVDEVVLVTGHGAADCEAALLGLKVRFVHNPEYATGLASSLRVGVAAVGSADAVVVCLGDMPRVSGSVVDQLIAAFNPDEHRSIVLPIFEGKIGNPVLWGAEHFPRLLNLSGDNGARRLITEIRSEATEVEIDNSGVLIDVDTSDDLAALAAG